MAERSFAPDTPELRAEWGSFAWDEPRARAAADILTRYPAGRQMSASIPFLDLAEDAYLRHVAIGMGVPESEIADLILDVLDDEELFGMLT